MKIAPAPESKCRERSFLVVASFLFLAVSACGGESGTPGSGGQGSGGKGTGGGAATATGGTSSPASGGVTGTSSGGVSGTATGGVPATGGTGAAAVTGGANGTSDAGVDVPSGPGTGGGVGMDGGTGSADRPNDGPRGTADAGSGGASTAGDAGNPGMGTGGGAGGAGVGTGSRSEGCGKNTTGPSPTVQQTLQVNGTTRYYLLTVPSGYSSSTPIPLLFGFHGRNGNNVWVSRGNDWYGHFNLQGATGGKAILVFPQGSGDPPGNSTTLNGTSGWNDNADDLGFFDALLTDIKSKYCIDTTRIFATGYSMGGAFSNTLACKRGADIRGIAPIAGWGPNSAPTSGTPSCATAKGDKAVMGMHGTKDGTIPYATGQASANYWRTANGCSATTTSSSAYPGCVGYQGCPAGKEVFFCTHSGDHQVPANAGANLWKFFSGLP